MNSSKLRIGRSLRVIRLGAEAEIHVVEWNGMEFVAKRRIPKSYRHPILDNEIRAHRTSIEARIMSDAKKSGVRCPAIIFLDLSDMTIYMQLIKGKEARDLIPNLEHEKVASVARALGEMIARLHLSEISHGDLTLSNIIIDEDLNVHLVDFGLATYTNDIEDFAVDIHLLDRSLESTHYELRSFFMENFLKGYEKVAGSEMTKAILKKVREIKARGRYVLKEMRC